MSSSAPDADDARDADRARRLLITRPRDDAEPLARILAAAGFPTLTEPMLDIVYRDGPPLDLDGVQALLATSANGVRAFVHRDRRRGVPVMAVGDATARAAAAAGFARVESAGGDVAALADLVIGRLDPAAGPLVHVAAGDVAGDLAGRLAAAGFTYRREVLYAAETAKRLGPAALEALQAGGLAGVLLFSPRTATTWVRLVGDAGCNGACGRLTALCLSRAVAERASTLPWHRVRVAAEPTEASLIAAVIDAFSPSDGPDAGDDRGNSVSPPTGEP